jgi:carotenoid cleavage dioxygenase-like enzyme
LAEPVFVPHLRKYGELDEADEEDGVILQVVTDTANGASWMAVLKPHDLSEICRVIAPQTINVGLHSHFFPDLLPWQAKM